MTVVALVVMGVSGSGKSTVGAALAERLGWRFVDADAYHPPANVEKMRAGHALTDADRQPWLERLNALLRHSAARGEQVVLACSALKARYRDTLADRLVRAREDGLQTLRFIHLAGDVATLQARLAGRQHEYMPTSLLQSQFDALEAPTDAWRVDIRCEVASIVDDIAARLARPDGD